MVVDAMFLHACSRRLQAKWPRHCRHVPNICGRRQWPPKVDRRLHLRGPARWTRRRPDHRRPARCAGVQHGRPLHVCRPGVAMPCACAPERWRHGMARCPCCPPCASAGSPDSMSCTMVWTRVRNVTHSFVSLSFQVDGTQSLTIYEFLQGGGPAEVLSPCRHASAVISLYGAVLNSWHCLSVGSTARKCI